MKKIIIKFAQFLIIPMAFSLFAKSPDDKSNSEDQITLDAENISADSNHQDNTKENTSSEIQEKAKNKKKTDFSKQAIIFCEKLSNFIFELGFYLEKEKVSEEKQIEFYRKTENLLAKNKKTMSITREKLIELFNKISTGKTAITFDELKALLIYLTSLMSCIEENNPFSIKLPDIWQATDEEELLSYCGDFFESYKKYLDQSALVSQSDLSILKEKYQSLLNIIGCLIRNTIGHIKSGGYNKTSMLSDILSKERGIVTDKNDSKYEYQNSYILPILESMNEQLQNRMLYIENLDESAISEDKLALFHEKLITPIIEFLGLINYCIQTKYTPKHSFKNMKKEIEVLDKAKQKEAQLIYKTINGQNEKNDETSLVNTYIQATEICEKKAKNYDKKNIELTYYPIQSWYRECVHSLQNFNRFSNTTKWMSDTLFNVNTLFVFFGWEIFAYLKNINLRLGIGDTLTNLTYELYQLTTSRGSINDGELMKEPLDEKYKKLHLATTKQNIIADLNDQIAKQLQISPTDTLIKIQNIEDIDPHNKTIKTKDGTCSLEHLAKNSDKDSALFIENMTKKIETMKYPNIYINEKNQQAKKMIEKENQIENQFRKEGLSILEQNSIIDPQQQERILNECLNYAPHITPEQLNSWNAITSLFSGGSNKKCYDELKNDPAVCMDQLKNSGLTEDAKYQLIGTTLKWTNSMEQLNFPKGAAVLDFKNTVLRNQHYTGIAQMLNPLPCGNLIASGTLAYLLKKTCMTVFKDNPIAAEIKQFFSKVHLYLMGKKQEIEDFGRAMGSSTGSSVENAVTLDNECFSHLEEQGALEWLKNILNVVEKAVNGDPLDASFLARIPYSCFLTGPSGCGKTYVVNAFANSLQKITKTVPKERLRTEVEFLAIDPKYFEGIIRSGEVRKIDLIDELTDLLKESLIKNIFYIIYFDEFHLFFSKDGHPNQSRIADLLKFFNDLYNKQRDHKGLGGMYVICSTNKPEFIPHEFFDNGARLGGIYHFEYGNEIWMKEVMERELNKIGAISTYIDWKYLQAVLRGYTLTHSNLLEVINKAFAYSQLNNKIIDTALIYHFINQVIRKIIINKDNKKMNL